MTNGQREDQLSIKNWTEEIGSIQSQKLNTPVLSIQRTVRTIGRDIGQRTWPELERENSQRKGEETEKEMRREGKGRGAVGRHSAGASLTL
jgi:hypothetical protein